MIIVKEYKQTFFSSDYHFGHKNILKYDNRPFEDIDKHDQAIIANHNALITNEDDFYFLGDIALCSKTKLDYYLSMLNGNKHFIQGNHDGHDVIKLYEKYGTFHGYQHTIDVEGQRIFMCHFAHQVWERSHKGVYHLYGHSHHSLPDDPNSLKIDVGINGYDYKPLSFDDVKRIMSKKKFKAVDHHGDNNDR